MDEEKYKHLRENFPQLAELWKSAATEFPDEGLREYFVEWDNFRELYDKINRRFHDEGVRFLGLFDIYCPELKDIASDASSRTESVIEDWSRKAGWV